jgi:hypothetical protein
MVDTKPEGCQNMRRRRGGEKRSRLREHWPRTEEVAPNRVMTASRVEADHERKLKEEYCALDAHSEESVYAVITVDYVSLPVKPRIRIGVPCDRWAAPRSCESGAVSA